MLQQLHIQNYVIIDEMTLPFSNGFTVITGETGAGKSILLGAISLIQGNRADTSVVSKGAKKCIVEATFLIKSLSLQSWFDVNDVDYEDETIIRREVLASGKSRAYINDCPVSLTILKEFAGFLIDVHRQFETVDIQKENTQADYFDAYAIQNAPLKGYKENYKTYKALSQKIEQLKEEKASQLKEQEFLLFQLNELSELNLIEDEQGKLETVAKSAEHSEVIQSNGHRVIQSLTESDNCLDSQILEANRLLFEISKFNPSIEPLSERLDALRGEISDISASLSDVIDSNTYDPESAAMATERLDAIYKLIRKHQVQDVNGLIHIQSTIEEQTKNFNSLDSQITTLEKEIVSLEQEMNVQCQQLSKERTTATSSYCEKIGAILTELNMKEAELQVALTPSESYTKLGKEGVSFMFRANRGTDFAPLKKSASGGELSRLSLSLKSISANELTLPTIIYDEIDTGISGEVALKMGKLIKSMSASHQMVSISHTPQVASSANNHIYIEKNTVENSTRTTAKTLGDSERETEIATMLSGNPPSENAINTARELLKR